MFTSRVKPLVWLPLKPILARLPSSIAALVSPTASGFFVLPVKTALAQLPLGAVRVPFGHLRRGSPPGTFADNAAHDDALVDLPLPEILSLINPALLSRRGQKRAWKCRTT